VTGPLSFSFLFFSASSLCLCCSSVKPTVLIITLLFAQCNSTSRVLLTADMGLGYADHSLYHWPCPRALATATHLGSFAQGTAAAASGAEWDLAVHIGDIAYGNQTWLLKRVRNHWSKTPPKPL